MKSYNHLWERFISDENIELAIRNASKGKKKKKSVARWLAKPNLNEIIKEYAINFHTGRHRPKEIYDGVQRKKRTIIVPSFKEQVVHHMLVNVLKPIIMHGMYEHTWGSIPGRGAHMGMKRIRKWIAKGGRDVKYCLKMDVRKYFQSIPKDRLFALFEAKIHDGRFLGVLKEAFNTPEIDGIPLGFYPSQWIANWYLQGLDHFIKEGLRVKYYARYMDDMVVFGANKKKLHKVRCAVSSYMRDKLGLAMKGDWQVFKFEYGGKYRFLDFMGFRFYRNRVTMRRSIMLKASRKARKIWKKDKRTVFDARQMLSYLGWIDSTDTYGFYVEWVKPFVSIQKCKRRLSRYDRGERKYVEKSGKHGETGLGGREVIEEMGLCA